MKPGSIAVDLAVERGGNIEGSEAGRIVEVEGVRVIGYDNVPGRVATSASALYAKNLYTFLEALTDKETKAVKLDMEDEIVKATMLTRDGKVVHPNFQSAATAEPEKPAAASAGRQGCRQGHGAATRQRAEAGAGKPDQACRQGLAGPAQRTAARRAVRLQSDKKGDS